MEQTTKKKIRSKNKMADEKKTEEYLGKARKS